MMVGAAVDDHPVIPINDRGLTLTVDAGAGWVVSAPDGRRWPARENLVALLPLLERHFGDIERILADCDGFAAPPWDELLRLALLESSDYWAALALGWLESGYPPARLRETLRLLKDECARPQPVRHRALRLWLELRGR
jgi:hypothetical protein